MDEPKTTILITKETRDILMTIKYVHNLKTMDDAILYLYNNTISNKLKRFIGVKK